MKNFKIIGMLLCAVMLSVSASSCSDDDKDPDGSDIEGTWMMKNFDVNCDFTVSFKSNGIAWMHWSDYDETFEALYTATDDKIFFRDAEDEWVCEYTIKGGKLTVYGNLWGEDDDTNLFVFTRK